MQNDRRILRQSSSQAWQQVTGNGGSCVCERALATRVGGERRSETKRDPAGGACLDRRRFHVPDPTGSEDWLGIEPSTTALQVGQKWPFYGRRYPKHTLNVGRHASKLSHPWDARLDSPSTPPVTGFNGMAHVSTQDIARREP